MLKFGRRSKPDSNSLYQIRYMFRYVKPISGKWVLKKPDHMKKLPPDGLCGKMSPRNKQKKRRR
jgi:hypothetical protein